jgi:dTDP-4-amino-4,6-dideoxygalactose transaminase
MEKKTMDNPAILGGTPSFNPQKKLVDIFFTDRETIHKRVDEILDNSQLTNNGKYLNEFESEISKKVNAPSVAVANATLGLTLAMKGMGIKGKVIMPSFTFCATAHSAIWAGLEPVFVDIDDTWTIDPKKVEEAITLDTKAIVGVHTFGNPCNITELTRIARENNLQLIFDAAHALGAEYKTKQIGSFGDAEVFSTHATKTLVTGEGGLISTKNSELYNYIKQARNFGFDNNNLDTLFHGTNAKLGEFGAICGLDTLQGLNNALKRKREIAQTFTTRLSKVKGIQFQKKTPESKHACLFFGIILDESEFGLNRDQLAEALDAEGIMTRKYFYPALHQQTSMKKYTTHSLSKTEEVAQSILCLPINAKITSEEVNKMCDAIENIHRNAPLIKQKLD